MLPVVVPASPPLPIPPPLPVPPSPDCAWPQVTHSHNSASIPLRTILHPSMPERMAPPSLRVPCPYYPRFALTLMAMTLQWGVLAGSSSFVAGSPAEERGALGTAMHTACLCPAHRGTRASVTHHLHYLPHRNSHVIG